MKIEKLTAPQEVFFPQIENYLALYFSFHFVRFLQHSINLSLSAKGMIIYVHTRPD